HSGNKKALCATTDSDSEKETKAKRKKPSAPEKLVKKPKSGDSDDNRFQIGKLRNASVRDFKGKVLVDIREDWMKKDGETKPRENCISPSPEQWNQLMDQVSESTVGPQFTTPLTYGVTLLRRNWLHGTR
uniref:Activated RNA polymerase II transcriptional coactivator p15 n=1 Tax=Acanthochromis polyacanthus TaxID=80966 RepID=A0A3Q1FL34_9TELE